MRVFAAALAVVTKFAALPLALRANDKAFAEALFAHEHFLAAASRANFGRGVNGGFFGQRDFGGMQAPALVLAGFKFFDRRRDPIRIFAEFLPVFEDGFL
jgi:hypothetical protein